jgi:hypothetical protein
MNLALNERAWKILDDLSNKTGKSKAEILRNSLVLMDMVQEQKDKNQILAFLDKKNDKVTAKVLDVL